MSDEQAYDLAVRAVLFAARHDIKCGLTFEEGVEANIKALPEYMTVDGLHQMYTLAYERARLEAIEIDQMEDDS